MSDSEKPLREQMRDKIALQGKSPETFAAYWSDCEKYIWFLWRGSGQDWSRSHPRDHGREAIEAWLTDLATVQHVAKNSQNRSLQAVLYLYKQVLGIEIENVSAMRAKKPVQVRDCISFEETGMLFDELARSNNVIAYRVAKIIYGTGLRIGKVLDMRIKDIHPDRCQLCIKSAKGDKGRYTAFPKSLHKDVRDQMESAKVVWRMDQETNPNGVSLPGAYRRKSPKAANKWPWMYLFPSDNLSRGPENVLCRHHRDRDHISKCIREASERAMIPKRVTPHILRHSYATHANELGVDVTVLQKLLGHSHIETTMTYVHANKDRATASASPLDELAKHLANPQPRKPNRDDEEPPTLRIFAG